jgi:hypothetical protein
VSEGFRCTRCGERHPGPPSAYRSSAPARWFTLSDDERELSTLDGELCVVETAAGREFFVRVNVELPVADASDPLVFSAWARLEPPEMDRMLARWEHPERTADAAYPAFLANDLPGYPPTEGLGIEVHTGPAGDRSRAVVLPTAHPLSDDQWEGITGARVQEIAELLAHPLR